MRKSKLIAFFLAVATLVTVLAGCNVPPAETKESESETSGTEGVWLGPDFQNEDLIINVSVHQSPENTFVAGDIYTRGPATIADATDTVSKMIYDRNVTVQNALGVNVIWDETNQPVQKVQAVIEQFVKLSPENTPDIFINDIYDVTHAMLTGSLKNLYNNYGEEAPEDGEVNYFDFDAEGWYTEYMRDTTIRRDKLYMVAGDYFVDMIRWAHVIYVNRTMFDEQMAGINYDMDLLYGDVIDRYWDYEQFAIFIETAFRDTNGDEVADSKVDESVGFIISSHFCFSFTFTCGLSVIGWEGEPCNSKPYIAGTNSDLFNFVNDYAALYNTPGCMPVGFDLISATTLFLEGNVLFTLSKMGEMESEQVRNSNVQKGVLPIPLHNREVQDDYFTLVHDQAEIGCILNNVRHFSAATAYLQVANELSVPILKEYYEKTLKLKYTEDADDKAMIDLIHDRIVSPFDVLIGHPVLAGGSYLPSAPYRGLEIYFIVENAAKDGDFISTYDSSVDGWRKNLAHLEEIFNSLE